jgi:hypothetical protein
MICDTLKTLDIWYNEPTVGPDRPKLLSKLAILELCGWIETEEDNIIFAVNTACLNDTTWTSKEIVEKNFGFDYNKHFRPMMVNIIGEHLMRKLENRIDQKHPGDLEQIRSSMGDLWQKRCNFAHEDMTANIAKQQRFDAPSWSINRHRILGKALTRFKAEAIGLVSGI